MRRRGSTLPVGPAAAWQAPRDGRFTFTTFGSNFNTVLAVYSGATFPGINVVFNDGGQTKADVCTGQFAAACTAAGL